MNRSRREVKFLIYVVAIFGAYQFINYLVKDSKSNLNKISENSQKIVDQIVEDLDENGDEKINWEDLKFYEYEKRRRGPGEQGEPYILTDLKEIQENEEWIHKEGFSVIVSEKISVDRAIPDIRLPM